MYIIRIDVKICFMTEFSSNIEAFDACQNRSFKVQNLRTWGEVVCPQWPSGGVWFEKIAVVDNTDPSRRNYLAKELGCATCPYPEVPMSRSITERFDEEGRPVKETRFEPVLEQSPIDPQSLENISVRRENIRYYPPGELPPIKDT